MEFAGFLLMNKLKIIVYLLIVMLANFKKHVLLVSGRVHQLCLFLSLSFLSTFTYCYAQSTLPKSGLSAQLFNLEAATNSTFNYSASLYNSSDVDKNYQLSANLPNGWQIAYKVGGSPVTALNVLAKQTQNLSIEIIPSISADPGKTAVTVFGVANGDSTKLDLEAVVKGTYGLQFSTPSGKLNQDLTQGATQSITLELKNTGNIALDGIDLSNQLPPNWQAVFDPSKISHLSPGETKQIIVSIQVPDKTLSGDYQATLSAKTPYINSDTVLRLTVKASLLTGWIGIIIIIGSIALVYFLIKKYGRR